MFGAEQGVARPDGHADELVTTGRNGPEGLAELTSLAHAGDIRRLGAKGQVCGRRPGSPALEKGRIRAFWPGREGRVRPAPAMYLATRNKPRKTNRKRSVRYKAKLSAKNRGRRQGLKK